MPNHGKGGRPTDYTEKAAREICDRIAAGESLISITKEKSTPAEVTVYRWLSNPDNSWFRKEYARARKRQADHGFEDIAEICKMVRAGDLEPNAARVEIDAIKWRLGKLRPQKYSDKIQIEQDHNIVIEVVNYGSTPQIEAKPKLVSKG